MSTPGALTGTATNFNAISAHPESTTHLSSRTLRTFLRWRSRWTSRFHPRVGLTSRITRPSPRSGKKKSTLLTCKRDACEEDLGYVTGILRSNLLYQPADHGYAVDTASRVDAGLDQQRRRASQRVLLRAEVLLQAIYEQCSTSG